MKSKITIAAMMTGMLCAALSAETKPREYPRARVTARVVDEAGAPLAGAQLEFVFCAPDDRNKLVKVEGTTGGDGFFSAEGYCDGGYGASVSKDGYYFSGLCAPQLRDIKEGRWAPWDPVVTVSLRPIVNPIPLFAKVTWIEVPGTNGSFGYDLEEGDWVAPHGIGKSADLIFNLTRHYVHRKDFNVNVELLFSHPKDGIQEIPLPDYAACSMFKWPREAPAEGYSLSLISLFSWAPNDHVVQTANEQQAYFFRIRTVEQDGRIISALYGKIKGGLELAPSNSKTCKIKLTYYLNPTSLDRNLEWDTKRNLLLGLSSEQTPHNP